MANSLFSFQNLDEQTSDSLSLTQLFPSHQSFQASQASSSPDQDSVSDNSKKIRKKRNTYHKIDDEARIKLLTAVQQGETLKAAAKRYNINYSSAKSILHTYRKEGRIYKKSTQERSGKQPNAKASPDMAMSPIYFNSDTQEDLNSLHETSTNQTHRSPDVSDKSEPSPIFNFNLFMSPNPGANHTVDHRLGCYLKNNLQTQVAELKPSTSCIFKLDSQNFQSGPQFVKGVQKGNWQLNLNIQNSKFENTPTFNRPQESNQVRNVHALKISEKLKSFESLCFDFGNSPMAFVNQANKDEINFDRRFGCDNFLEKPFLNQSLPVQQTDDVACFFESSPANDFSKKTYEANNFGQNMSWMDRLRAIADSQISLSDNFNNSYLSPFGSNLMD